MASVTLTRGGETLVVSTARAFVDAVYNRGYVPVVGTIESNYEVILHGGTPSGQDMRLLYSTNGTITNVIVVSAAEHAALSPKDPTTQYIIVG